MIPLRLSLRNFMSYGDQPNLLDFTSWRIACMSGNNGHGKSALFDAMTWSLWGRCRAKREDDVVRQGATHAEVEFEFAVGGGTYRVVRKRTVRRNAGQTTLELHVQHDGTWKTATGATVAETQAALAGILRLSYETFVNSAFLVQGRADEFTLKAPNERKKVLAEILSLGRYDDLADRARVLARERDADLGRSRERLADLERTIGEEAALLEDERAGERENLEVAGALGRQRLVLERLRDKRREVDRVADDLRAVRSRRQDLESAIAADRKRHGDLEGFIARCDALIADQEGIARGYAGLTAARAALEEAVRAASARAKLRDRIYALEKEISAAETGVRAEAEAERRAAAAHAAIAGRAVTLAEGIGSLTIQVAGLPLAETSLAALRARRQECEAESAALASENEGLGKQRTALRERLRMLKGSDAQCPVCRTPLGPAQRQEVEAAYVVEGTAIKERQDAIAARVATLTAEIAALTAKEPGGVADVRARQEAAGSLQSLQTQLQQAQEAESRARDALARAALIEARLGTAAVAPEAHAELSRVRDDLALIAYDEQHHAALQREVDTLAEFQERHDRLHRALAERLPRQEQLDDVRERLRRADKESCDLAAHEERLRERLGDPGALDEALRAGEAEVQALESRERELQQRLGHLRGALQRVAAGKEEHAAVARHCAGLEKEQSVYTDLAHAFGRQGIQAMLIDAVLPEIETVANEILARMTDNSVHVQFSTQRTGAAGNVIETLDIRISDAAGTRSYEMFSGGEAFRVNFAIRIALSRLLAGRAGASLQTLIIDEGFGSQDGAGRERLVEAINSVAEEFQKIVVITHIDELKESFPVQIEIVKGPGGSQVYLTE